MITVREKSRNKQFIKDVLEQSTGRVLPAWLEFDPAKAEGKLITVPDRGDLPFELREAAIIEFYSQKQKMVLDKKIDRTLFAFRKNTRSFTNITFLSSEGSF